MLRVVRADWHTGWPRLFSARLWGVYLDAGASAGGLFPSECEVPWFSNRNAYGDLLA